MSDSNPTNVATDISNTEAAAQAVVSDVTADGLAARVSALEATVGAAIKAPDAASLAALSTSAAEDAATAMKIASDAQTAVAAVSTDVAAAKGWISDVEASAFWSRVKSFFSHL